MSCVFGFLLGTLAILLLLFLLGAGIVDYLGLTWVIRRWAAKKFIKEEVNKDE